MEKSKRIQSVCLHLTYNSDVIEREDIQEKLKELNIESFIVCRRGLDNFQCLVYNSSRFNIYTFNKFVIDGVVPQGEAVKINTIDRMKLEYITMDPGCLTFGERMKITDDLVTKVEKSARKPLSGLEKENQRLREELEKKDKKIKKLKNLKKLKNISFGDIIFNFNVNNIKVNNLGEETFTHITHEDKKQILSQRGDKLALTVLEKVHFHPESPENNNILMTNIRDKRLLVRRNDKWESVDERDSILRTVTKAVPTKIEKIFNEDYPTLCDKDLIKLYDTTNSIEDTRGESVDWIVRKLDDSAYSHTKALCERFDAVEEE